MPLRLWVIPVRADLVRGNRLLRWRLSGGGGGPRTIPREFLMGFCALADPQVSPLRIAEFAEEWGVLGGRAARIGLLAARGHRRATRGLEDTRRWRAIARATAALGRLLVALGGESPNCWRENAYDWMEATTLDGVPWITGSLPWRAGTDGRPVIGRGMSPAERRQVLGILLTELLGLGRIEPEVDLVDLKKSFAGITVYGPVGAAAAVLAQFAAGHSGRLVACCHPGCALPFLGSQPIPARHAFCVAHRNEPLRWQWVSRGKPKWVTNREGGDRHA